MRRFAAEMADRLSTGFAVIGTILCLPAIPFMWLSDQLEALADRLL